MAHRACETRIHCCGCKAESDDAFTARMFEALKRSNARDREGNERKAKKPGRPEDKKRKYSHYEYAQTRNVDGL